MSWMAIVKLTDVLNRDKFASKQGKTHHQLWHELCVIISKNPDKISSLKVCTARVMP